MFLVINVLVLNQQHREPAGILRTIIGTQGHGEHVIMVFNIEMLNVEMIKTTQFLVLTVLVRNRQHHEHVVIRTMTILQLILFRPQMLMKIVQHCVDACLRGTMCPYGL